MANLLIVYFFDGILDEKKLATSLDQLVKYIPQLSSVIKSAEIPNCKNGKYQGKQYVLEHVTPSNVKLYIRDGADELFDLFQLEKGGLLDFKEGGKLHQSVENIEVGIPLPKEKVPVMKVTLLKGDSKCLLGVSLNHAVADGPAFARIMKIWESMYNGETKLPEITYDRKPLFTPSKDYAQKQLSKEQLIKFGMYHPPNPENDRIAFSQKLVCKNLVFKKEDIEDLKKNLQTDQKISSFCVICAHMWKLYSSMRMDDKESQMYPLLFVLDTRKRVSFVKDSYIGNAVCNLIIELSKADILSKTITELSQLISSTIKGFKEQDFQDIIDEYERRTPTPPFNWRYGIHVDDWRHLTTSLPQLNGVNCKRLTYCPPGGMIAPNFSIMVKSGDGVAVSFPINADVYEKIKEIDLVKADAIEKVISKLKKE